MTSSSGTTRSVLSCHFSWVPALISSAFQSFQIWLPGLQGLLCRLKSPGYCLWLSINLNWLCLCIVITLQTFFISTEGCRGNQISLSLNIVASVWNPMSFMMTAIKSRTATYHSFEKNVAIHCFIHLRAKYDFMKCKTVQFAKIS